MYARQRAWADKSACKHVAREPVTVWAPLHGGNAAARWVDSNRGNRAGALWTPSPPNPTSAPCPAAQQRGPWAASSRTSQLAAAGGAAGKAPPVAAPPAAPPPPHSLDARPRRLPEAPACLLCRRRPPCPAMHRQHGGASSSNHSTSSVEGRCVQTAVQGRVMAVLGAPACILGSRLASLPLWGPAGSPLIRHSRHAVGAAP